MDCPYISRIIPCSKCTPCTQNVHKTFRKGLGRLLKHRYVQFTSSVEGIVTKKVQKNFKCSLQVEVQIELYQQQNIINNIIIYFYCLKAQVLCRSIFNPIQDGGPEKSPPPPYQFFPYNF